MDDTKNKIAEMVKDMRLERKKPATQQTKAMTAALYARIASPLAELNKLHLTLWHATQKGDYHSMELSDARERLKQIEDEIHAIISESF